MTAAAISSTAAPSVAAASEPNWVWSLGPFVVMCVGMFIALLDIQIVASSLQDIGGGLSAAQDQISWVQTAYLIAEVIAIPLTGWLTRILTLRWLFGLAISLFPLIVPYKFTLWDAASSPSTQAFLLVGTVFLLPVILMYSGWSYWVFRGKVRGDLGYH